MLTSNGLSREVSEPKSTFSPRTGDNTPHVYTCPAWLPYVKVVSGGWSGRSQVRGLPPRQPMPCARYSVTHIPRGSANVNAGKHDAQHSMTSRVVGMRARDKVGAGHTEGLVQTKHSSEHCISSMAQPLKSRGRVTLRAGQVDEDAAHERLPQRSGAMKF